MSKIEALVERRVIQTLEVEGKLYVIDNVPARIDEETGEQFFAPHTVERLRETSSSGTEPEKVIETPVYGYSD